MIWKEVESKYGKKIANKMHKSNYLQGITVSIIDCPYCKGLIINKKCKICKDKQRLIDIPERDIDLAYRDVKKQKIYDCELD